MAIRNMSTLTKNAREAKHTYVKFNRYLVFHRFMMNVTIGKPDECWEWEGGKTGSYGQFAWRDAGNLAHVASYKLFVGHISKRHGKNKLFVLHTCDNPSCVNPKHLWLGTDQQNMDDMVRKGRSLHRYGANAPSAVFSAHKVKKIRGLYASGKYTYKQLAYKTGVSLGYIWNLVNGRNWKVTGSIN